MLATLRSSKASGGGDGGDAGEVAEDDETSDGISMSPRQRGNAFLVSILDSSSVVLSLSVVKMAGSWTNATGWF